jgi:molecular chaperone DnaK
MDKVIGIDLGTTNSCVVIYEGDAGTVIPNDEGSRTTPSIVAFSRDGERMVGGVAKRQAITNAKRTVFATKRMMGRKLDSEEMQRLREMAPFEVVAAENGDAAVRIDGRTYTPQEIASFILAALKETAETYLDESVTSAVITVPAYFDDAQRNATRDAGRLAGRGIPRRHRGLRPWRRHV